MPNALILLLLQACPQGDLAYSRPAVGTGLNGAPSVVTDGILPAEGTTLAPVAVALAERSQVTIDLGAPRTIRALVLQGDSDDVYHVQASPDGVTWHEIWAAPSFPGEEGLRTRFVQFPPQPDLRYLRVRGSDGDSLFSISEIRAYCEVPQAWPPVLVARPEPRLRPFYLWWTKLNQAKMVDIKGIVALLGCVAPSAWKKRRSMLPNESKPMFPAYE